MRVSIAEKTIHFAVALAVVANGTPRHYVLQQPDAGGSFRIGRVPGDWLPVCRLCPRASGCAGIGTTISLGERNLRDALEALKRRQPGKAKREGVAYSVHAPPF